MVAFYWLIINCPVGYDRQLDALLTCLHFIGHFIAWLHLLPGYIKFLVAVLARLYFIGWLHLLACGFIFEWLHFIG
jgi:hypothetical protein